MIESNNSSILQFVRLKQAEYVLSNYDRALLMQVFFVTTTVSIIHTVVSSLTLFIWGTLQVIILVLRKSVLMWHIKRSDTAVMPSRVELPSLVLVALNSTLWGCTAFVLDFSEHPYESIFIISVNLAIGVGSTTIGSYWYKFHLFYLIPFALLFTISFLYGTPDRSIALAMVSLVSGTYITYFAYANYNNNMENLKLRKKNEILAQSTNQFIAAASHDLRQPTQALSLLISALEKKDNIVEQKRLIEQLKLSSYALNELLNQILDISKLNADTIESIVKPVDLSNLFDRLHRSFQALAKSKGLTISFDANQLWTEVDPILLERILANLIGNAVKYTDAGEVKVLAKKQGTNEIILSVTDTGIGISDEEQIFVFDAFYQVGNSARNTDEGIGVGLYVVNTICNKLNIPLSLSSQPNEGSCFTMTLPACEPEKNLIAEEEISLPWDLSDKCILVIEDNQSVMNALLMELSSWGMSVISAFSREDALTQLSKHQKIDLIISDLRLDNNENGMDVIELIRNELEEPDIPALIISGDTAASRLEEVNRRGFNMLHKPVKTAHLRSAIQRLTKAQ